MFKSFIQFIDDEVARRNSTWPVMAGLWIGIAINTFLFGPAWCALSTTMDPITFMQQTDLMWYTKVLGIVGYYVMGLLTAFLYGEMTSAAIAMLFGFYTLKTNKLGPKVFLFFILSLLMLGIFPYLAMVGFLAIRSAVSDVGMLDPTGLLVGGLFVTILGVVLPGLLSDPQSLAQKKNIVATRLLEAATDSAEAQIRNNPLLALKVVGIDQLTGGVIDDGDRLWKMLENHPHHTRLARSLSERGKVAISERFPEDDRIGFERNEKSRRSAASDSVINMPASSGDS